MKSVYMPAQGILLINMYFLQTLDEYAYIYAVYIIFILYF